MKNYIHIIMCWMVGAFCFAQNYNNDKVTIVQEKLLFIDYTASTSINKESPNSLIFINQQGKYNHSNVIVKSKKSNVEIQQIGNKNQVDIDVVADKVDEKIIQIGDENIFKDFNHLNKRYHGIDVFQKGDNQSIYLNGKNSISERIKIKQIGRDKTIHINNYK